MKKYKNIYLFFLIVLSIILTNYQNSNINKKNNSNEDNSLSYFISSSYDMTKDYVYVKNDSDEVIANKISSSSQVVVEDGKVRLYTWSYILEEWLIVRVDLGNLKVSNNNIILNNNIAYNDFISEIKTENATYKIFNNDIEITSGEITTGMKIKFYHNEDEIDEYDITDDYLNIEKLNIKDDKYIIKNVSTVGELKKEIDTSGNITIEDKDGNILDDNKYLTTASKVKITLADKNYDYTIVILGDVTGSGDIFIGDISKLYQYYKGTLEMDECYVIAGDITYDSIIEINDIAKLYQYYKGTINSLK